MKVTIEIDPPRPLEEVEAYLQSALALWDRHVRLADELKASNDAEIGVLRAVRRYLSETSIDVPPALMKRIGALNDEFMKDLRGNGKSGKEAETANIWPMAWLAASVTALRHRRTAKVSEATQRIALLASIPAVKLKSFRKNALSNTLSSFALETYRKSLDYLLTNMTEDEFDHEVERCARACAKYLRNPSNPNT